jgi:hypothetical protein
MNWQPTIKDVNERDLKLVTDYGYGEVSRTVAHVSEGDTLFIRQTGTEKETQRVALTRDEFYNLIFNFMSGTELVKMAEKKLSLEYKNKL